MNKMIRTAAWCVVVAAAIYLTKSALRFLAVPVAEETRHLVPGSWLAVAMVFCGLTVIWVWGAAVVCRRFFTNKAGTAAWCVLVAGAIYLAQWAPTDLAVPVVEEVRHLVPGSVLAVTIALWGLTVIVVWGVALVCGLLTPITRGVFGLGLCLHVAVNLVLWVIDQVGIHQDVPGISYWPEVLTDLEYIFAYLVGYAGALIFLRLGGSLRMFIEKKD